MVDGVERCNEFMNVSRESSWVDVADALCVVAPELAVVLAVILAVPEGTAAAVLTALVNEADDEDRLGLKRDWVGGESESLSDGEKMVGKDDRRLRFMTFFQATSKTPAQRASVRLQQDGGRGIDVTP